MQAKTHLSRYARRVKRGETIVLCDRNKPFAEIRPIKPKSTPAKVKLGFLKGKLELPDDFNEPLLDFEKRFYGEEV